MNYYHEISSLRNCTYFGVDYETSSQFILVNADSSIYLKIDPMILDHQRDNNQLALL